MSKDFTGEEIVIDNALGLTKDMHEAIRRGLEVIFDSAWRVITLMERSASRYKPRFTTRCNDHPEYVIAGIETTYEFEAIEDGPRYREVNGEFAVIPRPCLYGTVKLVDNGRLRIIETSLMMPC